jgi:hypothetical protein
VDCQGNVVAGFERHAFKLEGKSGEKKNFYRSTLKVMS